MDKEKQKKLFSDALGLAKVIHLDAVFFKEFEARDVSLGHAPLEATLDCSVASQGRVTSACSFEANAHFAIEAKGPDEAPIAEIRGQLCLKYSVPTGTALTPESVELFAATNGLYHAWPYWREFVQNTSVRLNLPPIVMPPMQLSELVGTPGNWKVGPTAARAAGR